MSSGSLVQSCLCASDSTLEKVSGRQVVEGEEKVIEYEEEASDARAGDQDKASETSMSSLNGGQGITGKTAAELFEDGLEGGFGVYAGVVQCCRRKMSRHRCAGTWREAQICHVGRWLSAIGGDSKHVFHSHAVLRLHLHSLCAPTMGFRKSVWKSCTRRHGR